jgi:hypothetical protein
VVSRAKKKRAALASLALIAAAPVQAAELPALLAKVGAHVEAVEKRLKSLDYTERSVDEQRAEDGKVLHKVVKSRKVLQQHGPKKEELQKVVQDGRDITAQVRAMSAGKPLPDDSGSPNPFLPAQQPRYDFSPAPADARHAHWVAIAFKPKGEPQPDQLEGVAWVDPAAAQLRRLSGHPAKLPPGARSMEMEVEYDQLAKDGMALQSKMRATIETEVAGLRQTLHTEVETHFLTGGH